MYILHLGTLEKPIRGPFKTAKEAEKWAEKELAIVQWHITKLVSPE